jgi:DUF4097 and DUF4098 domain-containing protein YvlB
VGKGTVKRSTRSIITAVIIIVAILSVCVGVVVYHATAPLAQRQDKTSFAANENVKIQAITFNGNIEVYPTTGSEIELVYNVAATEGYLNDIDTSTNETRNGNLTLITAKAVLQANQADDYAANLVINLPRTGNYNLTLTTSNGDVDVRVDNCFEINAMSMNGNVEVCLAQGTLFQVAASVANGNIDHQGIVLDSQTDTATRLKAATLAGEGNLVLTLMSGYGNITIKYVIP